MPAKGHRTVTIGEEYYLPLSKRAEKNNRSISGEVEAILKQAGIKPAPSNEVEASA